MQFQQSKMDDEQEQIRIRRDIQDMALPFFSNGKNDMEGYIAKVAEKYPQQAMELHQNELRNKLVGLQTDKAQRDLQGTTREINSGDNILTQEQQPDGSWKTIATAPRWNPKQMGIGGSGGAGGGHFGPGAFQLIQGKDGQYYNVNKITGEVTPVQAGGAGVIGNNTFRDTSQQLKNADATQASEAGIDNVTNAINAANALKMSKGIGEGTGIIGGITRNIPGTDAYTFGRDLDSFKGSLFLQAFNQLRGGGAITDVEGQKATDAISAIDPNMSKADVIKHVDVAVGVLRQGLERAKKKGMAVQKATGGAPQAASAPQGMTVEQALALHGGK
jgi:hypothetical protein